MSKSKNGITSIKISLLMFLSVLMMLLVANGQVVDPDKSSGFKGVPVSGFKTDKIRLYKDVGNEFKLEAIVELKGTIYFNTRGIVGPIDSITRFRLTDAQDTIWHLIIKRELVSGRLVIETEDGKTYTIFNLGIGSFAGQIERGRNLGSDETDKEKGGQSIKDTLHTNLVSTVTKQNNKTLQPVGGRGGVRVSLGVIPDFTEDVQGFKITGSRPGSAAEKAGLKGGDIILKVGGKDIKSIYDFTYMLGEFKPGDEVEIVVKRGSDTINLKATLEASKN